MEEGAIEVAAIVGSLRRRSFNRALLRAALELKPPAMRIRELAIGDLPYYNEDLERQGCPAAVQRFRDGLAAADALLVITPEYNYSIPGALKNALDWASRPAGSLVLDGMPAAIMGAAVGRSGTMRAQLHLRQIFTTLDVRPLNKPEIYVTFAGDKFDADLNLTDEPTRDLIRDLLANLVEWTRRLRGFRQLTGTS